MSGCQFMSSTTETKGHPCPTAAILKLQKEGVVSVGQKGSYSLPTGRRIVHLEREMKWG